MLVAQPDDGGLGAAVSAMSIDDGAPNGRAAAFEQLQKTVDGLYSTVILSNPDIDYSGLSISQQIDAIATGKRFDVILPALLDETKKAQFRRLCSEWLETDRDRATSLLSPARTRTRQTKSQAPSPATAEVDTIYQTLSQLFASVPGAIEDDIATFMASTFKEAKVSALTKLKVYAKFGISDDDSGSSIGQGTYGIIFQANVDGLGEVAIKIHKSDETLSNEEELGHTVAEYKTMKDYENPMFPKLFMTFIAKYFQASVMELMSGGTLFRYINDTNITPAMRLAQLPTLLRTFAALGLTLSDKNIAHRDIKPDNIMFPSTDMNISTLKVIDLGLQRKFAKSASTGAGSEMYCAPEVLRARNSGRSYLCDSRVDMYGFGCTAIEFVLGTPAYKDLSLKDLRPTSVKKELKACNVPEGLIKLILSMVRKSTKDRLSDFQPLLYHPMLLSAPNPFEVVSAYMKDCDCQRMNAQAGLVHERTQKELALREVSVLRERLDNVQQLTTTLQAGAPSAVGAALPPANVGDPERRTAMRRMVNGTLVELEASGADYDKNSISLEVFEAFSNAGPTITVGDIRHFLTGDDPKYPDRAIPPQLLTEDRINLMGKTEANNNVKKARMGKGPTDKTRAQGFLRGFHKQYWSNVEE